MTAPTKGFSRVAAMTTRIGVRVTAPITRLISAMSALEMGGSNDDSSAATAVVDNASNASRIATRIDLTRQRSATPTEGARRLGLKGGNHLKSGAYSGPPFAPSLG